MKAVTCSDFLRDLIPPMQSCLSLCAAWKTWYLCTRDTRGGIPHPSPWAPGGIQLTFQHPEGVQLRSSSHCRKSGARTAVGLTVLALSLHLEEMRLFSSDIHTQSTHSVPYSRGCVVRLACRLLA